MQGDSFEVARLFHELDSIRSMLVTWVTRLASRSPNNKLATNVPTFYERIPRLRRRIATDDGTRPNEMTYVRIYVNVSRNVTGLFPRSRTKNLLERGESRREYLFHGVIARDRSVKKAGFSQAGFRLRQARAIMCCISGHYGKII